MKKNMRLGFRFHTLLFAMVVSAVLSPAHLLVGMYPGAIQLGQSLSDEALP